MKNSFLLALVFVFAFTAFGQSEIITVIEGVRIKDSHRAEAVFYFKKNWAKLRQEALAKGFVHSFQIINTDDSERSGFDIGLITRYLNKSQYENSEENFRALIEAKGGLKLLNSLKPADFRRSVFVTILKAEFPGMPPPGGASSTESIKLENDGWELFGDLTVPVSSRPVPAVILLNKAYGDRKVYANLAKRLARNGIASFRVDLRAHGASVNKGKFGPPFDEKMRSLLTGTNRDILAIHEWVKKRPEIDPNKIGFVGASCSGEEMVVAARNSKYAKAYVALSPGSFSEESMKAIDKTGVPWFFIKSVDEIALMKDVFTAIRANSKTARILEVSGKKHASDILSDHPDVEELITLWFKHRL